MGTVYYINPHNFYIGAVNKMINLKYPMLKKILISVALAVLVATSLIFFYFTNYLTPLSGFKDDLTRNHIVVYSETAFVPRVVIKNVLAISKNEEFNKKYEKLLTLPLSHYYMPADMQAELHFGNGTISVDDIKSNEIFITKGSVYYYG